MDTRSYFKNIAKSVRYGVDDLLKTKYPATYGIKNIKSGVSEAYKEFRAAEIDAARMQNNSSFMKEEKLPFNYGTTVSNLKSDLKSGKWYNKDRKNEYRDASDRNAFEMDFGRSLDSMSSSFGSLSNSINSQSRLQVTVAKAQMRAQRHDLIFRETTARQRHLQILQLDATINSNLVNLVEFNNNKMAPFMNQALTYFRDSMIESKRTNALLSEMRDMYNKVNDNTLNPKTVAPTSMEKAFSGPAGFNIKNYTKMVLDNTKGVKYAFDHLNEMLGEMGSGLMTSPIGTIMSWFLPEQLTKSLEKMEKTVKGAPSALVMNLMNIDKSPKLANLLKRAASNTTLNEVASLFGVDIGTQIQGSKKLQSGLAGILRSIFGVSTDTEYNIDRYEKGPMQFNGVTQKAIVTVIPALLGKIYTTLAGIDDDITIDYNNGGRIKWGSVRRKEIERDYQYSAQTSMRDFNVAMNRSISNTNMSSKQKQKVLKELEKVNTHLATGGSIRFNDPNFAAEFGKIIDPELVPYFISLFRSLPDEVLSSLPYQQMVARMSRSKMSRTYERESDLNGLAFLEFWSQAKKANLKDIILDENNIFDYFATQNEKYFKDKNKNKNLYKSGEINATNISTAQHQANLLTAIKDILIEGIIVYPMKRVPKNVKERKTSLRTIVENEERKAREAEIEKNEAENSGNEQSGVFDDLNDPNLGNIIAARIDPTTARKDPDRAIDEGHRHRGFKGMLQDIINSPIKAVSYMVNGFTKMMNVLIYGSEAGGHGLLAELGKKTDELKEKFKEWLLGKREVIKEKWNNSEVGKYVNEKYSKVKNWLTKPDEEGTNFASGFKGKWEETKSYFKNDVFGSITQFGKDLREEFSGTISQFTDLKTVLFGNEEKSGLFHKDYGKMLGDLFDKENGGVDIKKNFGKIAGTSALGYIGGLFLGGPILGAAIAGGSSFIGASDKLKEKLFGSEDEEGMIPKDLVEAFPEMKKGAGVGLVGHLLLDNFIPGGPITAMLIGTFGGYMKKHGMLDKLFWGNDGKDGKRKFKGLFTKMGDFFYDHLGGYLEHFIKKQVTKFAYTIDRWLVIPIKNAIKPIGKALSKSFQWMGKTLVKMVDKATGGAVSKLGESVRSVGKAIWWGLRETATGIGSVLGMGTRGLLSTPGRILSGVSNVAAKWSMSEEEYAEYRASVEKQAEEAEKRKDEQLNENEKSFDKFKSNKILGIKWSDLHPREQTAAVAAVVDDGTNRTVKTLNDNKNDLVNTVNNSTQKLIDELRNPKQLALPAPPGQLALPAPSGQSVPPVTSGQLALPAPSGQLALPAPSGQLALPAPQIFDENGNPLTDNLIGEDAIQQANEAKNKQQAEVLNKIELNTQQSASWLGGLVKGDGKKGGGLWDTIKNIGSGIWGIIKNVGSIALLGFGVYRLLENWSGIKDGGGSLLDAALQTGKEMLLSSRGIGVIRGGVDLVDNAVRGVGKVVNFGGRVGANIANFVTGGHVSDGVKAIANGTDTITGNMKKGIVNKVTDGVTKISNSSIVQKLMARADDLLKAACDNKIIGKFIKPLVNGVKKAMPEVAQKVAKAASKGILRGISKALVVTEIAFAINDAVTGFSDYRNILQLPADSPQDNMLASICAVVRLLNGLVCFGLVPEKWFVELLLKIFGKDGKLKEYQEEFKKEANDAGFGDNLEAYNRYENPTFWTKVASVFGLADSRKEIIEDEIASLEQQLNGLDPNSPEYKAIKERIDKLNKTLLETSDTWYEKVGNFLENIFFGPVKLIQSAMEGIVEKYNQWELEGHNDRANIEPATTTVENPDGTTSVVPITQEVTDENGITKTVPVISKSEFKDAEEAINDTISNYQHDAHNEKSEYYNQASYDYLVKMVEDGRIDDEEKYGYYETFFDDIVKWAAKERPDASIVNLEDAKMVLLDRDKYINEDYEGDKFWGNVWDGIKTGAKAAWNGITTFVGNPITAMSPMPMGGPLYGDDEINPYAMGAALDFEGNKYKVTNTSVTRAFPIEKGSYYVSSDFGWRTYKGERQYHPGIDYAAPKGTPIYAADGGVAYVAKNDDNYNYGWGNHVRIRHNDGYETIYGHASKVNIKEGDTVKRGQKIAEVGSTGESTGNHLHFGAYVTPSNKGKPEYNDGLNPTEWLNGKASTSLQTITQLDGDDVGKRTINGIQTQASTNGPTISSSAPTESNLPTTLADEFGEDNALSKILAEFSSFFTETLSGRTYTGASDSTSGDGSVDYSNVTTPVLSSTPPVSIDGVNMIDFADLGSRKETFLEKIQAGAIQGYLQNKIIPSLTLSQGVLESGWGDKSIGNNIYGIKANSSWTGPTREATTQEYLNGRYVTITDTFRDYPSIEESVADHNKFLVDNPRYAKVLSAKNYKEAAYAIQNAGYATSPTYASSLIDVIEDNKLYRVDQNLGIPIGGGQDQPGGMGGQLVSDIEGTLESYYNKMTNQISDTLNTNEIGGSVNIPSEQIVALLQEIAKNTGMTASGMAANSEAISGLAKSISSNNVNSTNGNTIINATNVSGVPTAANIFSSRVDANREKTTNAMRNYVNAIARGN